MSDSTVLTDLSLKAANGQTLVRDVMVAVLYSRVSNERLRHHAARAIKDIVEQVGFDALSLYTDYEGNQQPLDAVSLERIIDERLLGRLRAPNANVILSSAEADVPRFGLWYNGRVHADIGLPLASYLTFAIPLDVFATARTAFLDLVDSTVRSFPTSSGYVSRAFAGSRNLEKQRLARRYLAFDIADPLCVCADIDDCAAGAYWINFLGPALAPLVTLPERDLRAGRRDPVLSWLDKDTMKVELVPDPPTGDVNRKQDLLAFEWFAQLLESKGRLHVPNRAVYFFDANGMADREAMTAWHRRFLDVPAYLEP